jgi:uncharacterized membrane protein
MNTALWIMQSLVAIVFFSIGNIKTFGSKKKLQKMFSANTPVLVFTTRLLGFLEVLGAVGIILPLLLNIYPFLTAVAGLCLSTVMVGAAILHLQKKEYKALPLVAVLFIFSVLIAVNRY